MPLGTTNVEVEAGKYGRTRTEPIALGLSSLQDTLSRLERDQRRHQKTREILCENLGNSGSVKLSLRPMSVSPPPRICLDPYRPNSAPPTESWGQFEPAPGQTADDPSEVHATQATNACQGHQNVDVPLEACDAPLALVPLESCEAPVDHATTSMHDARLFSVPSVFKKVRPGYILDCGTGEMGFYKYRVADSKLVESSGIKEKRPLMEFLKAESQGVIDFTDAIAKHFCSGEAPLKKYSSDGAHPKIRICGGITGQLREFLSAQPAVRVELLAFVKAVQEMFPKRHGTNLTLRMFVVSSELEAMYELQATEWLMKESRGDFLAAENQTVPTWLTEAVCKQAFKNLAEGDDEVCFETIRHGHAGQDLGADELKAIQSAFGDASLGSEEFSALLCSECSPCRILLPQALFAGTLSAGGGSSQLTLRGNTAGRQLFSAPCGNRTALVDRSLSHADDIGQLTAWATRVQEALDHAHFPCGLNGLFIGISATYYAAVDCGVANRLVTREETIAAFDAKLSTLSPDDLRAAANLVLVREIICHTFSEDAIFLFRRNWDVGGKEKTVASWSLGACVDQAELLAPCRAPPRRKSVSGKLWELAVSEGCDANEIFIAPTLLSEASDKCYLLDFGSGEMGFYTYQSDPSTHALKTTGEKLPKALFDDFADAEGGVDALALELCNRFWSVLDKPFEGEASSTDVPKLVIGGATGLHRDALQKSLERRLKTESFLRDVEEAVLRLSGEYVQINLFVPSGELEAMYELRATEWLVRASHVNLGTSLISTDISQPVENDRMSRIATSAAMTAFDSTDADRSGDICPTELEHVLRQSFGQSAANSLTQMFALFDADGDGFINRSEFCSALANGNETLEDLARRSFFMGTISAGGGSSQLTIKGHGSHGAQHPQLFSIPIGNRVPIKEKVFSNKVTPSERLAWAQRVWHALESSGHPRGLEGLFVGISAVYYAAKTCKVEDRLVQRNEAIDALEKTLDNLDPSDHRTIANLTLVRELLEYSFGAGAVFLFKRNWRVEDQQFAATWTLGMYVSQMA